MTEVNAMNSFPRVPDALQWSEGMLLTPQHFQQNDIYWNRLVQHQMAQLNPHYWGLLALTLDQAALRAGQIHVTAVHAVMPDGLVVQYPAPGQKDVMLLDVSADETLRDNKPLTVHLAVPMRDEGSASRTAPIQRYDSVQGALELDENTGENRVEVGRMRPRLSLIAGDKVPPKYVSIPLLQMRRDIAGHFELTEYHPPLLRLEAARFIGDDSIVAQLARLATRIRAKAKELLGIVGDDTTSTTTNAYQIQVVRHLVAALPPFEVMVRTGVAHPFTAYVALANLVGHMSGIGSEHIPMLFDAYRHDDAAPGFQKALRQLWAILAKLNAAYEAVAFERERDDFFTCRMAPDQRPDRLVIELKPRPGQAPQALAQWLDQACIGSEEMMPLLRQRRLTGARVRPLGRKQAEALGVPTGTFFEIGNQAVERDGKLATVIRPGATLQIQGGGGIPPATIVLYRANRAMRNATPNARAAHG